MEIRKIGNRGVFFIFGEGYSPMGFQTSVYLIITEKRMFLCDTHVGPQSMEVIKEYIRTNHLEDKELIIFNSHSDYDHIWGNCAFKENTIISHHECLLRMKEKANFDLEKLKHFTNGEVVITNPNLTFTDKLCFIEDEIEFIYAPGHTICSSICVDLKDRVVYVGDLIEDPVPYVIHYDTGVFIKTLSSLKEYNQYTYLSSHSGIVNKELIDKNIEYLLYLLEVDPNSLDQTSHSTNVLLPLILFYENILKKQLKDKFDLKQFRSELWLSINSEYTNVFDESKYMRETKYRELELALIKMIEKQK